MERLTLRRWICVLGSTIALIGCQTAPPASTETSRPLTAVHPGDAALSVVGTPFYLVFKGVLCTASVALAAPVAAVAALTESRSAVWGRRELGDGVAHNCGPPYVLSPYRAVPQSFVSRIAKEVEPSALQGPDVSPAPERAKRSSPRAGPIDLLPDA